MIILLMTIDVYFIMAIDDYSINGYSINGYQCLFY
jgi:hypothetical protein